MPAPSLIQILRSVVFFESLSEPQLQRLADLARSCSVAEGGRLFTEHHVENHLYLIEQGRVEISRDGPHFGRQTFARLGPGEHFGALSLFYSEAHFATATALEPTRVWILEHEDFQACLRSDPELAFTILQGMAAGIRTANREIRRLTTLFDRSSRPTLELPSKSPTLSPPSPSSGPVPRLG